MFKPATIFVMLMDKFNLKINYFTNNFSFVYKLVINFIN